jgi:hypothetical protein
MSGYVGYALRAGKSKTGQKIIKKVKDFFTGGGKSKTISSVPPALGKLKKTQDAKKKITDITDKYAVGFAKEDPKLLKKFRKGSKKNLDSISDIYKTRKKEGGRIGRKFGGGADLKDIPAGKKFNGLRKLPKEVRNKMKYKKDGGKI